MSGPGDGIFFGKGVCEEGDGLRGFFLFDERVEEFEGGGVFQTEPP